MPPSTSCSIVVSFTPSAINTRSAAVTMSDNAAGSPQTVSLSGAGTAAIAALSATSLSFGNQAVGTTSAGQSVTLTNNGNIALTISSIAVTGTNAGDFSQSNNCGASLAPAATCNVTVSFTPSTINTRSAAVAISDNAAGSPQTVSLKGTGTAAIASLSATALSLGSEPVTIATAAQSITLTNSGNIALTISSITVAGANAGDFTQSNNCGASLAPSSSCSISVVFDPTTSGSRAASLVIADNAIGGSQTVALTGTGTDFSLSASPSALTMGRRTHKSSTISVTPISGFNQTVALGCSGVPANTTCSVSPASVTLNGSSASTAQLTITTTGKTPFGTFNVVVSGSLGTLTHSTTVTLTVN